ncbi:MAG: PqqD family peptide modification chaperone [Tabrizicola sp.]|nr:PqqD family peptide modification chaperone [Tabrizicola sp.]
MALDVFFQGIASPARFIGADFLVDLLSRIAIGWPYRTGSAVTGPDPFYTIRAVPDRNRLCCQSRADPERIRHLDPLNALCDLVAALAAELPLNDNGLICLHAAAVRVSGRVLVFPNVRRAGKSTLSVALAAAGHELIGDDVVPLVFDAESRAEAMALGIAPRLRLPVPKDLPSEFRAWLAGATGVENRQYHYAGMPDQPRHGARFPVSALVILDRKDEPVPARIMPATADRAMDVLLYQNFSRDRHSGDVLCRVAGMLSACPAYVLTYSDLGAAVRCLETAIPGPAGLVSSGHRTPEQPFRLANLRGVKVPSLTPTLALMQRPATEVQRIGATTYLADADGKAIHRLDPLAAAVWDLLSEPSTREELAAILSEAFPDAGKDRIASDLDALLLKWAEVGLIALAGAAE